MLEVKYSVGLDLGQASDPTAVAIILHERKDGNGVVHVRQPNGSVVKTRDVANRYDCVHLHRYPLGTTYPAIVQDIKKLMRAAPLCGVPQSIWNDADGKLCADPGNPPATLILDFTGCGAPVADMFSEAGVRHQRVSITSGVGVTNPKVNHWGVPKALLIQHVDAEMQSGRLRFAATLRESDALRNELQNFRRHISAAGRSQFVAREGQNDDLVLSVSLALWWALRPAPPSWEQLQSHYRTAGYK
jgi:hypothetical protein